MGPVLISGIVVPSGIHLRTPSRRPAASTRVSAYASTITDGMIA